MKTSRGFTLIEVIVTLIVAAIACAIIVTYIGTSFTQSAVPAGLVGKQYALIQQMEIITSQYRQALPITDLCAFNTANVSGQPFVVAPTSCNYTLTSGNYTTGNVLLVTLTNSATGYTQTLQSIFTQ